MGLIHLIKSFGLTIRESANDGSDFSNPDADYRVLFLGEDGFLHAKDSSGTVTDPYDTSGGSGVATDPIWDAAGDLAVGSGANTAAKLSLGGTNGMVVSRVSGSVAWALPPGYEFDYAQVTSDTTLTATTEGTAHTVVTGASVSYDGSTTVLIEFFSPDVGSPTGGAGRASIVLLYEDSTLLGRIGVHVAGASDSSPARRPMYAALRRTPSNASHTYTVKAYATVSANGTVGAGTGGSSTAVAAFLRITKV